MMQLEDQKNTLNTEFAQTYRIAPWLTFPLYFLAKYIVLPLYFGKFHFTGQENIPHSGPVILAPTHRSRWDGITMAYAAGYFATRRHLRFMVSKNEMKGFQGWLLKRLGCFPVDLERTTISSFRHSVQLLTSQEMLVIFPEGNIFRDGTIHPIQLGIARIAIQAQKDQENDVKIIPVSLRYSKTFISWGTDVYVDFGSPLNVDDYSQGSTKKNSQRLNEDLETAIQKVCGSEGQN
jgi:1-acyl-sn-glycerol-3-phosphate acyltransferase